MRDKKQSGDCVFFLHCWYVSLKCNMPIFFYFIRLQNSSSNLLCYSSKKKPIIILCQSYTWQACMCGNFIDKGICVHLWKYCVHACLRVCMCVCIHKLREILIRKHWTILSTCKHSPISHTDWYRNKVYFFSLLWINLSNVRKQTIPLTHRNHCEWQSLIPFAKTTKTTSKSIN